MDRKKLVQEVARQSNFSKGEVNELLETLLSVMTNSLENGNPVHLNGLGRFSFRYHKARRGSHPRTGDPIQIPPRVAIHFAPSPSIILTEAAKEELARKSEE